MSGLLKEIKRIDKPAADELMNAGLQSDSDIQALTEDDLRDLLPGIKNIKRRRAIYDIIHSQPMEQQKLEASLTESGSHVSPSASDHPEELQITPSDGRPQAAADSSAGSGTSDSGFEILNPENPDTKQREVMSGLLKKIEDIYKPAADELMNADLQSDSDIQALTEDDLRDLLPGIKNIKRRRAINDIIHSQPMEQQKLEASLTGEVMSGLLKKIEDIDKPAADELINADLQSDSDIQALTEDDLRDLLPGIKNIKRRRAIYDIIHSQQKLEASLTATSYKMVVGGKTFDTHLTLMEKIKKQVQNQIQSCEDDADNHSVTFVFCPISSRVASDVEAAMSDFKDDKPVILVLMHHTPQVKATSTMKTWDVYANVLLHVNVFYHETSGLLQCDENDAAVTEIQNKLLESFNLKSSITSGNAQGGGAERGGTGPGWRIQGEKPRHWIKASAK